MSSSIIAVAKGELGEGIQKYLESYGVFVELNGRPLKFVNKAGKCIFRPMRSGDVPWYTASVADYGITGEDLVENYNCGTSMPLKIVKRLGFGNADLVAFGKSTHTNIERKPVIAAPYYYKNLLISGKPANYFKNIFGDYDILEVQGSTEGFVCDGTADAGFDVTTYFRVKPEEQKKKTLAVNRLVIFENLMPTEAVIVSRCDNKFTEKDFETKMKELKQEKG
jgi:ATP phosphoribosyltransferase